MAFETIERVGTAPAAKNRVPDDGVAVRVLKASARGVPVRYIAMQIGPELARSLCLKLDQVALDIAVGSGRDDGHLGLAVNATSGGFVAKRQKGGGYKVTINAASADGLFSLAFEPFTVPGSGVRVVEALGKPPMAVFKASAAMLAVAD